MAADLQLFVYNLPTVDKNETCQPFILFYSMEDQYDFITQLKSRPRHNIDWKVDTFFVINNPHLLPKVIRDMHVYPNLVNPDPSLGHYYNVHDGYFLLEENIHVLRECRIENNTNNTVGFAEIIRNES